jgi:predicted RNA-binding protein with PUA-like domain
VSAARRTPRAAKATGRRASRATTGATKSQGVVAATKPSVEAAKAPSRRTPPVFASTGYWLMKSEPDVYSIDDLARDRRTGWEGVRNYQARNFMRDSMRIGDRVLFYHSNAEPSGVAGIAKVCGPAVPDETAFDPRSEYFDPKSRRAEPTWLMAQVEFVERFPTVLTLEAIRADRRFAGMALLARGQRLSVQPVSKAHFELAVKLGRGT